RDGRKTMLRVSRIGRVRLEPHRQMEGKIKTMTIKRAAGKYYTLVCTLLRKTWPLSLRVAQV
ncbi:MAG: hypothetical protein M1474_00400, partial [Candidatus Marsarchaeota archaeon]|nr:hypothetical protein [Candidatus Marsarchaeota archaeon]